MPLIRKDIISCLILDIYLVIAMKIMKLKISLTTTLNFHSSALLRNFICEWLSSCIYDGASPPQNAQLLPCFSPSWTLKLCISHTQAISYLFLLFFKSVVSTRSIRLVFTPYISFIHKETSRIQNFHTQYLPRTYFFIDVNLAFVFYDFIWYHRYEIWSFWFVPLYSTLVSSPTRKFGGISNFHRLQLLGLTYVYGRLPFLRFPLALAFPRIKLQIVPLASFMLVEVLFSRVCCALNQSINPNFIHNFRETPFIFVSSVLNQTVEVRLHTVDGSALPYVETLHANTSFFATSTTIAYSPVLSLIVFCQLQSITKFLQCAAFSYSRGS